MKIKLRLLTLAIFVTSTGFAQFSADAEFRPRTEYRHGFGTLIAEDSEPGVGMSTISRVNFGYQADAYKFYISLQDVFVWGENKQTQPKDVNNSFAIFSHLLCY